MIAALVSIALGLIAALHVYWCVSGVSETSLALPEVDGRPAFVPTRLAAFGVALLLAVAAVLVAAAGGLLHLPLPARMVRIGAATAGAILVLRAIGDGRLVGFLKRVRGTRFAVWDTRLFSPLCLVLGAGSLWVAFS